MTALIWAWGVILLALAVALFLWLLKRPIEQQQPELEQDTPVFDAEFATEITPQKGAFSKKVMPELPAQYGVSRMVLLTRDPNWLYTYWEVSATTIDNFHHTHGREAWQSSKPMLRIYDVTGMATFDGHNAHAFFDIPINETADNWHIEVNSPNHSFCADLGRLLPSGEFITILRSNVATTPRAWLSDQLDEEWMWLEDIYRSLSRYQVGASSPLLIQELRERMELAPLGISSPGTIITRGDNS